MSAATSLRGALQLPALRRGPQRSPVVMSLVGLAVVMAVVPLFVQDYWIFLATSGFLSAITVMGLAIIIGWAGQVTLAGAALLGLSVYITGYLLREGIGDGRAWPFIPAMIAGVLCAAVLSAFVAVPTARFSGIYVMVLTMGVQVTLERTLFTYPWITGGAGADVRVNRPEIFGFHFNTDLRFFYLCFVVMVIAALFMRALRNSRHGRAIQLVRTDRQAAAAIGISPWRYRVVAFGIGGALIGVAGAFTAPFYLAPPALTQYVLFQSLFLLAIPVVAGTQTIVGLICVAVAFQILPTALQSHRLSVYLLGGAGLIAGTLVGPRGMAGSVLDLLQRRRDAARLAAIAEADTTPAADAPVVPEAESDEPATAPAAEAPQAEAPQGPAP